MTQNQRNGALLKISSIMRRQNALQMAVIKLMSPDESSVMTLQH